jgi:hypothetical protein
VVANPLRTSSPRSWRQDLREELTQLNDEQPFVLVPARKSRRADYWDKHDYDVRDSLGKVVGRIAPSAGAERTALVLDDNGTRNPSIS